jgi:hypothetical protein
MKKCQLLWNSHQWNVANNNNQTMTIIQDHYLGKGLLWVDPTKDVHQGHQDQDHQRIIIIGHLHLNYQIRRLEKCRC